MPTSNRTACRRPLLAPLGGPGRGLLAQRGVCCLQTLLRRSVTADGCPSAIRLLTTGFDLPALTLVRQLQRYAMVAHAQAMPTYGDSERCQRGQFVPGTSRPAQSEPTKLQDALQVGVEI